MFNVFIKCAKLIFLLLFSNFDNKFEDFSSRDLLKIIKFGEINHRTFYLFSYKNMNIKDLIWQIKFRKDKSKINLFSDSIKFFIKNNLISKFPIGTKICLIPVPLSSERMRERGFNQAELFAEYFYFELKNKFEVFFLRKLISKNNILKKQSWKNKNERLNQKQNPFYLKKDFMCDTDYLIVIDDIITTGKTREQILEILSGKFVREKIYFIAICH